MDMHATIHPSTLDNPKKCMTCVKHKVGGYRPTVISQNSGGMGPKKSARSKGSAKSYLDA